MILFALLFFDAPAFAGTLSISSTATLTFGKFAAGNGGSVTVSPAGARSSTGGVGLLSSSSGSSGRFVITGDPNAAYSITLPSDGDASLASGSSSMPLTTFSCSPSASGSLDASGTLVLSVGATLNVDALKLPADYSGSYTVVVNYQ